jgi:gliding motility-associated-like protein
MSSAFATGGYAPYSYSWSYAGQTGDTAYLPIAQNGTIDYYVTATDACGFTGTDTVTVTMNQTLMVDSMYMVPTSACQITGVVVGLGAGMTGQPHYHWEGPGVGGTYQIDASVMQNLPAGTYYFSISDNVCFVEDSIVVTQNPGPIADFTSSLASGCIPLSVTLTNTSQNATNYSWNFGNGNTLTVANQNPINQVYNASSVITLIAYNGPCADTVTGFVATSICGCMDPAALNYNPLANVDDGSCVYPTPTVEAPNVFTPDGDGVNDLFELTTTHAEKIELIINNRWGNLMFSGSGSNPTWDGKVQGTPASEGVYFYQYTVTGIQGDILTGHGFVELFRSK